MFVIGNFLNQIYKGTIETISVDLLAHAQTGNSKLYQDNGYKLCNLKALVKRRHSCFQWSTRSIISSDDLMDCFPSTQTLHLPLCNHSFSYLPISNKKIKENWCPLIIGLLCSLGPTRELVHQLYEEARSFAIGLLLIGLKNSHLQSKWSFYQLKEHRWKLPLLLATHLCIWVFRCYAGDVTFWLQRLVDSVITFTTELFEFL